MKMLCIDASGKTAACAVTEDGTLLAQSFTDSGLTHSQTLLPMTDSVLKLSGVGIDDIDEFAITNGPGSFTGLRIGLSLVMGLANGRPVRPVPTLSALAHNLTDKTGYIVPVMDARRSQVYTALFKCENGVITRLEPDSAIPVESVIDKIRGLDAEVWMNGDGAYLFDGVYGISYPDGKLLYTQGESIARAAAGIEPIPAKDVKLSYLRLSQAERELKEKQKND